MKRRFLLQLSALLCLAFGSAHAQPFPERPVTLIVPYSAGGPSDAVVRALGREVAKTSGQTVIVENRPGGATVIGTQAVLNQAADGYTLGIVGGSFVVAPRLLPDAPYHPQRDLAPISLLFSNPHVLVVAPHVPASTLQEFIAWAATARGTYSSFGVGSSGHLGFERFKAAAGIDLLHVPYKGGGPAMTDLLGGQIDFLMDPMTTTLPHVRAGRITPIAITSATRSPLLPDVPTFAELGMPDFVVSSWFGLFAPAATPPEVVKRLSDALIQALQEPDVIHAMQSNGIAPMPKTSEEMADYLAQENVRWQRVMAQLKIGVE